MIDLEDAQPVGEFPLTQAEGIQAGAENDVLPGSGGDRVAQVVLGKAEAQDVLGVDRFERLQEAVDDDSVQRPVVGDQSPEGGQHVDRVGVGDNRRLLPAHVAGADRRPPGSPSCWRV